MVKLAGKYKLMVLKDLKPNKWNPNRQAPEIYQKELNSIKKFGFAVPVIVRVPDKADPKKPKREIDAAFGKRPKSDAERGMAFELIVMDFLAGAAPELAEQTFAQAVEHICATYLKEAHGTD